MFPKRSYVIAFHNHGSETTIVSICCTLLYFSDSEQYFKYDNPLRMQQGKDLEKILHGQCVKNTIFIS